MKLLVLGGTVFLGRGIVDSALERGHEVTLFTRGRTNPDLYPDVEKLRGDRDGDLRALEGRGWDAVIDPSGYVPRVVGASARLLAGAVPHYTFVSSISVYASVERGPREGDAVEPLEDPRSEDVQAHYGALKAASEAVVEGRYPEAAFLVRPGLIVGPHDPTNRFTYWVTRIAEGGDVLAPGDPERPVQVIDYRDLGDWLVRGAEERLAGVFNATGPEPPLTMGELLEACKRVSGSDARFVWAESEWLEQAGAAPWSDLPLWLGADPEMQGVHWTDVSRAVAAGLQFRPIAETIRDTLAWARSDEPRRLTDSGPARPPAGLARGKEAELLSAWQSR